MSLTDPVADLLARIRNSIHARHQKLDIPASKLKLEIAVNEAFVEATVEAIVHAARTAETGPCADHSR